MYVNNKHLRVFRPLALLAGLLLLTWAPFFAGCRARPLDTKTAEETKPVRAAIPAPRFISIRDGEFALDSFKGQPLIVSVQGVGTPYLSENLRELDDLGKELASSGVAVVGLLTAFSEEEDPGAFAQTVQVSYPLVAAVPEYVREVAQVRALPTVLLVDERGVVRKQYAGDLSLSELKADVQALASPH